MNNKNRTISFETLLRAFKGLDYITYRYLEEVLNDIGTKESSDLSFRMGVELVNGRGPKQKWVPCGK